VDGGEKLVVVDGLAEGANYTKGKYRGARTPSPTPPALAIFVHPEVK